MYYIEHKLQKEKHNGCRIEAYPSNHIDAYRALDNPKFILLDEADFFRKGEQEDVRHVSERYIAKSDPYMEPLLVSWQLFGRMEGPHVAPVWFVLDENNNDDIILTTWHESIKGKSVIRDPRVSISVDNHKK